MPGSYTKVNWVNGTTACSQANLGQMDQGIADSFTYMVQLDNAQTITGIKTIQVTTGGTTPQDMLHFKDTSTKDYKWIFRANGTIGLYNVTDSKWVWEADTGGDNTQGDNLVWTKKNDGAGSGLDADTIDGIDSLGLVADGNTRGVRFYVQNGTPASPAPRKYDVWVQTPFV